MIYEIYILNIIIFLLGISNNKRVLRLLDDDKKYSITNILINDNVDYDIIGSDFEYEFNDDKNIFTIPNNVYDNLEQIKPTEINIKKTVIFNNDIDILGKSNYDIKINSLLELPYLQYNNHKLEYKNLNNIKPENSENIFDNFIYNNINKNIDSDNLFDSNNILLLSNNRTDNPFIFLKDNNYLINIMHNSTAKFIYTADILLNNNHKIPILSILLANKSYNETACIEYEDITKDAKFNLIPGGILYTNKTNNFTDIISESINIKENRLKNNYIYSPIYFIILEPNEMNIPTMCNNISLKLLNKLKCNN